MAMKTGIMIVCRGNNPPVDIDPRHALQYFQSQANKQNSNENLALIPEEAVDMIKHTRFTMQDSMSSGTFWEPQSTRKRLHKNGLERMVTSVRSNIGANWSAPSASMPPHPYLVSSPSSTRIKVTRTSPLKMKRLWWVRGHAGRTPLSLNDVDLLGRAFQRRSTPSLPQAVIVWCKHPWTARSADLPYQGICLERRKRRSSLRGVWSGWTHTPFHERRRVYRENAVVGRDAVLLNAALRKAHEERTRVVTSLLLRARTSEYCNEVLQKERIAMIPDDDTHNAAFFTDYANFKKLRSQLTSTGELVEEGSVSSPPSEAPPSQLLQKPQPPQRQSGSPNAGLLEGGGSEYAFEEQHSLSSDYDNNLGDESPRTVSERAATIDGGMTPPVAASCESSVTNSHLRPTDWHGVRRRSSSQAKGILFGKEVLPPPIED